MELNENEYKERLLTRICKRLDEEYIDYKIIDRNIGVIYIFELGAERHKPSLIYNPYEASCKNSRLEINEEGICIENVISLFRLHFKE
jgi:hypothetical protein